MKSKIEDKSTDVEIIVNPDDQNPFDFYNENCVEDVFNFLLSINAIERNSANSVTYVKNAYDRKVKMIIYKDGYFIAAHENGLGMKVGSKLKPFAVIQKFKFKDNFRLALNYVIHDKMRNSMPYIRVGIKYYKRTAKIDRNGVIRRELKLWDKPTILSDYGKESIDKIPIYDDFTLDPDNVNFRAIVNNNYNLYSPFEHVPQLAKNYKGEMGWYWTKTLLEHIFGDQYELGLMYISTLYKLPKQKLPILVLVSEERSTGKTTFVDWLDILFGGNTVIINPQDIENQFNGSYADKNIVMIEESKFKSRGALEKLKNLSTQKKILVNTKFVQQYSLPFHGHLIITSNDENKFSKIDASEIRYWIRKVPTLEGKANHNILSDMTKEIAPFLYYLSTLDPIDTTKSRMIFTPEALNTDALQMVKRESRSSLYKDIEILIDDFFVQNNDVVELMFSLTDIKDKWFNHNNQIDRPFIKMVLRDEFKARIGKMQRYIPFDDGIPSSNNKKSGRPYIFTNPYIVGNDID